MLVRRRQRSTCGSCRASNGSCSSASSRPRSMPPAPQSDSSGWTRRGSNAIPMPLSLMLPQPLPPQLPACGSGRTQSNDRRLISS